MTESLTRDVFVDGRFHLWQPRAGYRAATDPILLAAATPAETGQSVLELGCGAGAALIALGTRVPGLALYGAERQADYADLARRNLAENGLTGSIETADLTRLPPALRLSFDHVIANPPYYPPSAPAAADPGRAQALREETPLGNWIDTGLRRAKPGGYLTMIHRIERLPHILATLSRFGGVSARPIAAREGRDAGRVIVQMRKGSRAPFRLLAPLIMHEGPVHARDGDDFSSQARALLRDGAALPWT